MQTERFFRDIFGKETGDEITQFFSHDELVEIGRKMVALLYPDEFRILTKHYGIYGVSQTLKEIGRALPSPRSISVISNKKRAAISKLRHKSRSHHILVPLYARRTRQTVLSGKSST